MTVRVLILADNEIEQVVLKLVLAKLEAHAEIGGRGTDAVRLCEGYDAMIADLASLDRSRLGLFRTIAERPSSNRPRLIAITNDESKDERQLCLELGFSAYIAKPYSLAAIRQALAIPPKEGDLHDGKD